jgi:hypothetical protein
MTLLCIILLFPVTVYARSLDSRDRTSFNSTGDLQPRVLYNVSDTGTFTVQNHDTIILSDHNGKISVAYSFIAPITAVPQADFYPESLPVRVVFKLGILDLVFFIPETSGVFFVEPYYLKELPKNTDFSNISRLFNCKLGQVNYDSSSDLDNNGIINMRDIARAIIDFQKFNTLID